MTDITELQDDFQKMRAASRSAVEVDYATRKDRLKRLKAMLLAYDAQIVAAINADFGCRVPAETRLMEIVPLMNALRHASRKLRGWMRPSRRPISVVFLPGSGRIVPQPLGLVGIIAPWNYPLFLTIGPLIDVLAAGNRAMIKPSELCPAFSELLGRIISETFAPDEVQVVQGGADVAEAFSALPFDHVIFTGSASIGRKVAQAAAANLTPVTLELGGKSPVVITPDANLAKAAKSIAFGKFVNAGQTCVAPDYVLVPRAQMSELVQMLEQDIRNGYPDLSNGYTSTISQRHFDRHAAMLDELASETEVRQIGDTDATARRFAPTLVLSPPPDAWVMREEIFGPILPIIPYDDLDEALQLINAGERPLAVYCFASSAHQRDRVVNGTIGGGMTVNGTLLHLAQDELPFGGVGNSGSGVYHGYEGFKRFSHMKPVFRIGFYNAFESMGPPWGKLAKLTYRFLVR